MPFNKLHLLESILIKRHGEINLSGPGLDPTIQIDGVLNVVVGQKVDDLHAADSMMTDDDILRRLMEQLKLGRDLAHRYQLTAFQPADIKLPGLAYIDQARLVALQVLGQLLRAKALHNGWILAAAGSVDIGDVGLKQGVCLPFRLADAGHQLCLFDRGLAGYSKQSAADGQRLFKIVWNDA